MTLDQLIASLINVRAKGGDRLGRSDVHLPAPPDEHGLPQTKPLEMVEQGRRQVWLS